MAELLNKRQAGVFLAISSLPSEYGVGDFGQNARNFIDILAASEFKIWQILPLNTLGYGNSPYQAYTSEGIDPLYIDLDELYDMKLISKNRRNCLLDQELIMTKQEICVILSMKKHIITLLS